MLKLSIVLTILLVAGINSDKYDAFRSKHSENQFSSGKPRHHKDEKIEESASFKPVLQANGPPLPSPCTGFRAKTKIPHPFEKSKYIQCRDEFHYDVFACPTGTQYNPEFGACRTFVHIKDRCEEETPCLNDGVCSIVSNTTLKCVCGPDWTGDRCEIPVNSCVMKPCGPTGECRTLKTTDSEQDYICLCQNRKEYGYNCQDVVPSPCISGEEVFFPFAFSNRAYIQCDGELIYFQSCGSLLYWNQEEKYCDRKRSHTVDASAISTKPAPMTDEESGPSHMVNDDSEELTTLPPTKSTKMITKVQEPIRQPMQRPRIDSEPTINFVPSQNINRRPIAVEGPAPVNNFQEQRFQDNQFIARPKFESPLPETTTRNIPIEPMNEEMPVRPWQNPSRPDRLRPETQFRFPTTTTAASIADSNVAQSFMRGESFSQPQQPPRFNPSQQRFAERTNEERVPAVTNEERFPPVFSNRFRTEHSFAPTFPTRATTLAPMIRENSFSSSSMSRGNAVAQPGFISDQQRFSERTSEERFPERTNEERFPERTNEERVPTVFSNRFRAEPSFAPTFPTRTTTLAPMIRENSFSSPSMGGANAVTQPGFFPDQEIFPERINEERVPPVFSNRFRAEPSFAPTFTTTTTITTTMEPMIRETVTDSAPVQEESFQPWFHKFNLQSSTQPTLKGALIEPTTLAANIIRGPNFPAVTDEEEEFAHESTTTTTPPSFHTRAWPKNGFVTPSWPQRQRQPLPTADSSLVSSQGVRRNEPVPMENGETWSTSTETMPFHQQRSSNMNNMDTNNLPSGEFQSFNTRRGMTNQNQARQQEQNMPSQSVHWKPRF